jgi:hypothetical protein
MAEPGEKPEFSAWALFLVSLSQGFIDCYKARVSQNLPGLYNTLEATSLLLAGYYPEKKERSIREALLKQKPSVDKVIKEFEEKESYTIPPKVWEALYSIEWDLRVIWRESGLQITTRPQDDDMQDY